MILPEPDSSILPAATDAEGRDIKLYSGRFIPRTVIPNFSTSSNKHQEALNPVHRLDMRLTVPFTSIATILGQVLSDCELDSPGCSVCTECVVLQLNTAGCDSPSAQEVVFSQGGSCKDLLIGMNNAWISESTGWYDGCDLYGELGCTGKEITRMPNVADHCSHTEYWIKSIYCHGKGSMQIASSYTACLWGC